ncbi:CAMK family protein kinase [Tritrichomonas foetus]|uniref:CAMK family protein kinase n=1 Tax=Tritrichomonas foetus TaxID=1144522 RepID=A0A1J4JH41_9EUKA|nr:CAMK family protein kinase [Tritrichomonas foetus]|eukprot:OHS96915.1 CAMK family protein kinase [Tritrichomonas foetus]
MEHSQEIVLPYQIRSYVLESVIGYGGFGTVYKAKSLNYGNEYEFAVKSIKMPDKMNSKHYKHYQSFESEVQSLKRLDHPNIIRLYDYFQEGSYMFLVLEYCEGGTLETNIPTLTYYEKIKACLDIVNGITYIHENMIAHRDIKTLNILFDSNGRAKIADFGLSQKFFQDNDKISKTEGSLLYISPEIIKGVPFSAFKSDIWALGVLIYRVFTGIYPFSGFDKDEIVKNILCGIYNLSLVPPPLVGVVKSSLLPHPEDRMKIETIQQTLTKLCKDSKTFFSARLGKLQRSSIIISSNIKLASGKSGPLSLTNLNKQRQLTKKFLSPSKLALHNFYTSRSKLNLHE